MLRHYILNEGNKYQSGIIIISLNSFKSYIVVWDECSNALTIIIVVGDKLTILLYAQYNNIVIVVVVKKVVKISDIHISIYIFFSIDL
jgi:hypothetical protein